MTAMPAGSDAFEGEGAGVTATIIATVNAINGFNGDVNSTATGLPPGVSMIFNPPILHGGGTSTATITTSPLAPLDSFTVTVTATSAGVTKSQTFTLTLATGSDFSLTSTVSTRTIPPGTATFTQDHWSA